MNHEQFSWSDEECLENYVDWNAPAMRITLDLLKRGICKTKRWL